MINLLPPETRKQLGAARTNRLLLRYNLLLLIAIAFMLAAVGLVYIYLGSTKASAESTIAENIARAGDYDTVDSEANSFRQQLASVKQILDSDTKYTKVALEIAGVLPSGVVLETLNLDSTTFGTPTTLVTKATDYDTVLRLKESLQRSTIFSDASIQSINDGGGTGKYPLTATFSVTIRKDAAK